MSFPIQKQLESDWCWAAVSSSTDDFFSAGPSRSQCDIASTVIAGRDCCLDRDSCNMTKKLQDVLGPIHRLAGVRVGWLTFMEIKREINAGRPIAVRVAWFGGGAHFVLICGYKLMQSGVRKLEIADPFYGDEVNGAYFGIWEIDYDLFPESYQDGGEWTATFFVH